MPGGGRSTSELFRALVDVGLSVLVVRENRVWVVHVVKMPPRPAAPLREPVKDPALFVLRSGSTLDQALRAAIVDAKGRGWVA